MTTTVKKAAKLRERNKLWHSGWLAGLSEGEGRGIAKARNEEVEPLKAALKVVLNTR